MNAPFTEMRRLHDRGPRARGLVVDAEGVMLGPNCVLVARTKGGYRRIDAAAVDQVLKTTFGDAHPLRRFSLVLDRITDALTAGDLVKAQLLGLEIRLGALDDEQLQRMQTASSRIKAGFDPNQTRDERGRWTAERGSETGAAGSSAEADQHRSDGGSMVPVADKTGHTPAEKERFVEAHLADAQKIAAQLHVPVENILALSALESGWGDDSRFAREGNNFFSIHCSEHGPPPFAIDCVPAQDDPKVKVATFANYADSARSFADKCGKVVQGKADSREFAAALQDRCKYGIDEHGSKVPTFVGGFAGTARSIRLIIARRQI
jgi:hypothetical protein